jgi:hypothetical protein
LEFRCFSFFFFFCLRTFLTVHSGLAQNSTFVETAGTFNCFLLHRVSVGDMIFWVLILRSYSKVKMTSVHIRSLSSPPRLQKKDSQPYRNSKRIILCIPFYSARNFFKR